jgi:predicted peptidase
MGKRYSGEVGQMDYQFSKEVTKRVNIKYLLSLPDEYHTTGRKFPLILFLHGAGERGDDLNLVKMHGPLKIVEQGKDMPFVILAPQCPEGRWWPEPWMIETVYELLLEIKRNYRIDEERIYLTGLSMGGFGTWHLAISHPEEFAAIAPICGGGIPWLACNIQHLPVWAFHGARDDVVSIEKSREMVKALQECDADVKFTVYPDATHDSWTQTYENPDLYSWFLKHKRSMIE